MIIYFPTLEGDISQRWHTSGFISFLESPNLVMISFCRQNYICLETCNANFTFHLPKHAVAHIPFSNGHFAMSTECTPPRNLLELVWLLGPPRLVKSGTLQCPRNAFHQETCLNWFGFWGPQDLWSQRNAFHQETCLTSESAVRYMSHKQGHGSIHSIGSAAGSFVCGAWWWSKLAPPPFIGALPFDGCKGSKKLSMRWKTRPIRRCYLNFHQQTWKAYRGILEKRGIMQYFLLFEPFETAAEWKTGTRLFQEGFHALGCQSLVREARVVGHYFLSQTLHTCWYSGWYPGHFMGENKSRWTVPKRPPIPQGREESRKPQPKCWPLSHGDSNMLLTRPLTLTYASQGFAYT